MTRSPAGSRDAPPWWARYLPRGARAWLDGREQLQKSLDNTVWLVCDRLLRLAAGFAVSILVTRYLGAERYGVLSYALAFTSLLSPLASLGTEDIVVRDLVRFPGDRKRLLGSALALRLAGGLLSFLAAACAAYALQGRAPQTRLAVVIIASGSVFQALNVIECWFNSQLQAKYVVMARNVTFFFCTALKVLLVLARASLIAFAWVSMLEVAVGSFSLLAAYRLRGGRIGSWRASRERIASLLRDSWPLACSIVAMVIYQRIDQVMLGQMAGSTEVGIYSVAVRLAEVWGFVPTAIYWSVFPSVVSAQAEGEDLFHSRLQRLYNLMALWGYAVAVPLTLFADRLVLLLYGASFARAGTMLAVLVWAGLFSNLELARSSFLATMNWTKAYFVTVTLGAALNVVLNLFLIPRYGGIGAAAASLASYWFAVHGSCYLSRDLRPSGAMITRALFYPKIW